MFRTICGRLVWLGRATSAVVGLAVVLALVVGVSSQALAGDFDPLKIGSLRNVATKTTQLVGKVASGEALVLKNPSGGSALGLQVDAGKAPLKVNPEAGTATGLSADEIDGKDSSAFLGKTEKAQAAAHADTAGDSDTLDGRDSGELGQMWAVVNHTNSTCTLVRESGATKSSSSNFCGVQFDHDISGCAYIAGLSEPASGYPGVDRAGEAWAFVGDGAPDTVYVRTANSSGAKTALPFHVSVFC